MAACARLATRARPLSRPNPGVAALLIRPATGSSTASGHVMGRGWTQTGGRPHAEALALSDFADGKAEGATLYVTLEPCAHKSERGPACADLVIAARPSRVVIGQLDPDPRTAGLGVKRIERAGIKVSVLEDAASRESLCGYFTRAEFGRPRVTLKLAVSMDGCIAMADGSSQWITGEQARAHVHAQRARHDAILVGGATWRADRPRLDVRLPGLEDRSPARVLLSRGVAPDGARVINRPGKISDLADALTLYVEGGAVAGASFLSEDLVDEIHIYRAPIVIGDGLRGLSDIGIKDLASAHGRWQMSERRQLGSDEFTAYLRRR